MTIGDRIRIKRTEKDLSQTELARLAGYYDKTVISRFEHAGNDISMKQVRRIADALNVSPAYLMGWENERPSTEELTQQLYDAYEYRMAMDDLSREEQIEIREIVKLLLSLPRSERQFLRDWLASHGKQT